jgi:hypothetical protein
LNYKNCGNCENYNEIIAIFKIIVIKNLLKMWIFLKKYSTFLDGLMGRSMDVKAIIRIAYSSQKYSSNFLNKNKMLYVGEN